MDSKASLEVSYLKTLCLDFFVMFYFYFIWFSIFLPYRFCVYNMASSWCFYEISGCTSVGPCTYICFLYLLFKKKSFPTNCWFVLFQFVFVLSCFITIAEKPFCFLMRDRKRVEMDGGEVGETEKEIGKLQSQYITFFKKNLFQ